MSTVILVVTEAEDPQQGHIHRFDNTEQAARMMETLLEAGINRDRLEVFVGDPAEFEINHRPVVTLADDSAAAQQEDGENGGGADRRRMSDFFRSSADEKSTA